MDSLLINLEPRPFQGLLNGLVKKNFYGETLFTDEYLAQELYGSSEIDRALISDEITQFQKVSFLVTDAFFFATAYLPPILYLCLTHVSVLPLDFIEGCGTKLDLLKVRRIFESTRASTRSYPSV
jgi:hypothetical protein